MAINSTFHAVPENFWPLVVGSMSSKFSLARLLSPSLTHQKQVFCQWSPPQNTSKGRLRKPHPHRTAPGIATTLQVTPTDNDNVGEKCRESTIPRVRRRKRSKRRQTREQTRPGTFSTHVVAINLQIGQGTRDATLLASIPRKDLAVFLCADGGGRHLGIGTETARPIKPRARKSEDSILTARGLECSRCRMIAIMYPRRCQESLSALLQARHRVAPCTQTLAAGTAPRSGSVKNTIHLNAGEMALGPGREFYPTGQQLLLETKTTCTAANLRNETRQQK